MRFGNTYPTKSASTSRKMVTLESATTPPPSISSFQATPKSVRSMTVVAEKPMGSLLVEGVADYALYMLDPTGTITSWNIGAQRIKGLSVGKVLGLAAALHDRKNAVQTQSYGPESRGGACKSEVVLSDGEINYPKVRSADVLVALSQTAQDIYLKDLKAGGLLIVAKNPTALKAFES